MLWSKTAYCVQLSGEDLSRYSNEIESVGLRKCPYYHYLNQESDVTITNIYQSLPHVMAGNSGHYVV